MEKDLQNLLRTQKADDLESLVLDYFQTGSNDDPGLTLTIFMIVNFVSLCFCMSESLYNI